MAMCGEGLRVVDLSLGFASAVVVGQLRDAGATVVRFVPSSGDPFEQRMPSYPRLKAGEILAPERLEAALDDADICIVGGDDVPEINWHFDIEAIAAKRPALVVLHIGGYPGRGGPSVDLLVQARTGLVHEQLPDRPVAFATQLPSYGAALTGLLGVWAAIVERDRSGHGQIVRATMQQGVSLFWSQIWMQAEKPDALFDKLPPKGVKHLIFQCADGEWLHFVLGVPGAMQKLFTVLDIDAPVDPNDRGIPTLARGPGSYFADRTLIAPAVAKWSRDALVEALNAIGLAAEPVLAPGAAWSDRQVVATGLIRQEPDGARRVAAPFRFTAHFPTEAAPLETTSMVTGAGPLAGVRVVDLGNFIAGPFASKLLADFGADVIRVEPPGNLAALTGIRNTWSSNRGKRSIVQDMKQPEGLAFVHRLCASADVVMHNFRGGVAPRLGVDPASLRVHNPRIVTLETSGYGSDGPRSSEPGWDMVMQALSGHEMRAGGTGNEPLWYRSALVDFATGALGAIGCLMGVHARNQGMGSIEVQNSLLATALFLMSELIQQSDGAFVGAPMLDLERCGVHPAERLYRTADGWIAVAARSEEMAAAFAAAMRVDIGSQRSEWSDTEAGLLTEAIVSMTTDAMLVRLADAGVWAERCVTDGWAGIRDDPEARETGLVIEAEDATYGRITSVFGPMVRFSRTTVTAPFRSSPVSGADADAIRIELDRLVPLRAPSEPHQASGYVA